VFPHILAAREAVVVALPGPVKRTCDRRRI
jgi:hypothetical protein